MTEHFSSPADTPAAPPAAPPAQPTPDRQTGPLQHLGPAVASELHHHLYLKERLEAEFSDLDDETLADTLEGETRLNELLAGILRSREEDLGLVAGLKGRVEALRLRLQRFEERAARKRALVSDVMSRAAIKRLVAPEFTVSLRMVPSAPVIEDEALIPDAFWRPQVPKLDRVALGEALKAGQIVPGTSLGAARPSISIRIA